jgi:hypothetical protein
MANTSQRSIRVADELWESYGAACAALGTDRTKHLVDHMTKTVEDGATEGSKGA